MNTAQAFEAWIAENWPNLAAPWWLSSDDAIQQLEAFKAGAKHGGAGLTDAYKVCSECKNPLGSDACIHWVRLPEPMKPEARAAIDRAKEPRIAGQEKKENDR